MNRYVLLLMGASLAVLTPCTIGASSIAWGPPTDTTSSSDVSTTGAIVKAFDSGGGSTVVNGVVFAASGKPGDDLHASFADVSFDEFDDGADLGDLDQLLRTGIYSAPSAGTPPAVVTLTGLTVGARYEIQLFFMDQRNSPSSPPSGCTGCADREVTFSSGVDSLTLEADPDNELDSPYGQHATGAFVAEATTQTFEVSGTGFDPFGAPISLRQVNAWQLRVFMVPILHARPCSPPAPCTDPGWEWEYTFTDPTGDPGWATDGIWADSQTGHAPFGNVNGSDGEEDPYGYFAFASEWLGDEADGDDLWLRTEIDLTGFDLSAITWHLGVDNGFKLYVNGNLVCEHVADGYTYRWEYPAAAPICPGTIPPAFLEPELNHVALALRDEGVLTAFDMEILPEPGGTLSRAAAVLGLLVLNRRRRSRVS